MLGFTAAASRHQPAEIQFSANPDLAGSADGEGSQGISLLLEAGSPHPPTPAPYPPSLPQAGLALTLLCFYLRQHSLQERQRLPVVLGLHFYELRNYNKH